MNCGICEKGVFKVVIQTDCGHTYHSYCWKNWKNKKENHCPICRSTVQSVNEITNNMGRVCKKIAKINIAFEGIGIGIKEGGRI